MVSLVMNSPSLWRGASYTADVRWQPPGRETRHPARADPDEPDASRARADAQAVGRHSGIGVEHEAGRVRPVVRSQQGLGKNVPRPDVQWDAFCTVETLGVETACFAGHYL